MSLFKTRNKKQVTSDTRITLDAKHNEMVKHFKELKKSLPERYDELEKLKKEYQKLKVIPKSKLNDEQINSKFNLKEDIIKLECEIDKIENNEEERDYFLKAGPLLYKYYNNIDEIAKSDKKKSPPPQSSQTKKKEVKKEIPNNSIISFFSQTNEVKNNIVSKNIENEDEKDIKEKETSKTTETYEHKDMCHFVVQKDKFQRASLLNEYLKIVDPNYSGTTEFDDAYEKCIDCGSEKVLIPSEGYMVCESCGQIEYILVDSDRPSYKDPPPEQSYFAYKRSNHFNEWLSCIQAKESTDIPQKVFDKIAIEIKKERITNLDALSRKKVREYLKKLDYNKYYEHTSYIMMRLTGKQPPQIPPDIEEKLRQMFKDIQEPFAKVCPKNRRNFLSYSYVLYKFLELLGEDKLKHEFSLLKSREKLHQQDIIWKGICKINSYHFIKSV